MTLAQNIHQLINEHVVSDGYGGYTTNRPLLEQLKEACSSDLGTSGNGRGTAGRIPINAAAVDLDIEIRKDLVIHQEERTGERCSTPTPEVLKIWADLDDPEWEAFLENITADWVTSINALFTQRKPPMRPSIPCPSCGQRFHGEERDQCLWVDVWDHDNDTMAKPGEWTAGCDGCGATWDGDNLKWFVAATRLT
ncbi:DUF7341 domain-containing protein [Arthrobacter woluwensis]|uniref:DUF7341 domain-containing protein n=1 Tax=Arthrobacter woluwensis TaxID=156980 RepID=A0A1H4TD95_9MICC|nr:hypothetical protein [Arthrobacter woluwensis]SEC54435.1 hypothetical protein SAMN04489745_3138 [Arthrobacter woluwensis]SEC90688.1 hypothetical protein SAMN04489745_3479 [Arthrobacter woluwensis]